MQLAGEKLELKSVTVAEAGAYICSAVNRVTSPISKTFTVRVLSTSVKTVLYWLQLIQIFLLLFINIVSIKKCLQL